MKKILQMIAQGIVTGLTMAVVLYFLIESMSSGTQTDRHVVVKQHYTIEDVEFSDAVPSNIQGAFETTITFKTRNENKKELVRVFTDIEFYDSENKFLFDHQHGSPWGELYLPPKDEDNISIDVIIPESVSFSSISKVTVELYELTN